MRTLTLCLLALALAAPTVASAQDRGDAMKRPDYQLVVGEGGALPGVQIPVFVHTLSGSEALIIMARDASGAKALLERRLGVPSVGSLEITRGLIVALGGPMKNSARNLALEQGDVHLATYRSAPRCEVDRRRGCSGDATVLTTTLSGALDGDELTSAFLASAPAALAPARVESK